MEKRMGRHNADTDKHRHRHAHPHGHANTHELTDANKKTLTHMKKHGTNTPTHTHDTQRPTAPPPHTYRPRQRQRHRHIHRHAHTQQLEQIGVPISIQTGNETFDMLGGNFGRDLGRRYLSDNMLFSNERWSWRPPRRERAVACNIRNVPGHSPRSFG